MNASKKNPIIILHGWNLSGSRFSELKKALERLGYPVFSPDFLGFGTRASLPKAMTIHDYVEDIASFIKEHHLEKVIVIGHSFGGRIGIMLGNQHADLLKCLILTGAPGILPVSKGKVNFILMSAKIGKVLFSIPPLSLFYGFAQKVVYKLSGSWDYYNTQGSLRETFKNVIAFDLEPFLCTISIPTLLVWGQNDTLVPPKIGRAMNDLIPNSQFVLVENTGHSLPFTNADKFAPVVDSFISTLS